MYSVVPGETFHQVILVLPDTLGQIGCHSNIDSAVSVARQKVDAWLAQWIPAFAGTTMGALECVSIYQSQLPDLSLSPLLVPAFYPKHFSRLSGGSLNPLSTTSYTNPVILKNNPDSIKS